MTKHCSFCKNKYLYIDISHYYTKIRIDVGLHEHTWCVVDYGYKILYCGTCYVAEPNGLKRYKEFKTKQWHLNKINAILALTQTD